MKRGYVVSVVSAELSRTYGPRRLLGEWWAFETVWRGARQMGGWALPWFTSSTDSEVKTIDKNGQMQTWLAGRNLVARRYLMVGR